MLQHAGIRRNTNEQLEFRISCSQPQADDERRQEHGCHGIDPPPDFRTEDSACETGSVDEEIVAVVFPENANLAVCVAQSIAIQKQAEFGREGNGDDNRRCELILCQLQRIPFLVRTYRSYVELSCRQATILLGQLPSRHDDKNQRNRDHQEAERDVAGILDASLARRKAPGIDPVDSSCTQNECQVAQRIKDRVRHGREQR